MTEAPILYIPKYANSLASAELPQIRLGIQGYPGSGKTWGALTFPNPVVMNLDRGLGAHRGKSDVHDLPFYDAQWVRKTFPQAASSSEKDSLFKKEAIMYFMRNDAMKLTREQTLVFDGGTGLQNLWELYIREHPIYTKAQKICEYSPWRLKVEYLSELLELTKSLKCNFVYMSHEAEFKEKPDSIGDAPKYTGKLRPLMTGQFADQLVGHFTDWFRQHSSEKPTTINESNLPNWGMKNAKEYQEMLNSFSNTSIYYWQTAGDDKFDAKASSLVNAPKFIPANYQSLLKWMAKV